VTDAMLASTFVKPSTAPTLTGSNFTGIPTSAIIGYSASTTESISGTTALDPTANISIVTGSTHSLALSSTPGMTKTIINNNPNAFSKILTGLYTTTNFVNQSIRVLKYDAVDNRMYIGGNFTNLNGVSNCTMFCYYDFASTQPAFVSLGTVNGEVYDILISGTGVNKRVYITGAFTLAGGITNTARIAYVDVTTSYWYAMGTGLSSSNGENLLEYSGSIYVCGSFGLAGGVSGTVKIARWNIGTGGWNSLSLGIVAGSAVYKMQMFGTRLWICGNFGSVPGATNSAYLAYWDGSGWNGYGPNQYTNNIWSILNIGGDNMVVVGQFSGYGSSIMPYSSLFNQSTFTASLYGVATNNNLYLYLDNEGMIWNLGIGTQYGNQEIGFEQSYYPYGTGTAFLNTSTTQWVPIMGGASFRAMAPTSVPGEYWVGGSFTSFDGVGGFGSLAKFNKNNITTINSTLINNGQTFRNNFNLYWNGQTVNLVNYNNTRWTVATSTGPNTQTVPTLILY
jgi:hypothetical protein